MDETEEAEGLRCVGKRAISLAERLNSKTISYCLRKRPTLKVIFEIRDISPRFFTHLFSRFIKSPFFFGFRHSIKIASTSCLERVYPNYDEQPNPSVFFPSVSKSSSKSTNVKKKEICSMK